VTDRADDLHAIVREELTREPLPAATRVAEAIVARHGAAVASVLFYGSCLRRGTSEGVLDFYVLVDRYRDAYPGRVLAWANALLPPNVFYLEVESEKGLLRSKYAVVSSDDFARGARPAGIRSSIWARFCQPAIAVWNRDPEALERAVAAVAQSIVSALETALPLVPRSGITQRFSVETLWQQILRETYASEMRTEAPESIRGLYEAAPDRYAEVTRAALGRLAAQSGCEVLETGGEFEVSFVETRSGYRLDGLRRPLAKTVYVLGLLKSAFTFGDWLPYVLWKLERHTGTKLVPTERQRRHPLLWGWPLLLRVLWRRDLH
jgi:hypothetical protein